MSQSRSPYEQQPDAEPPVHLPGQTAQPAPYAAPQPYGRFIPPAQYGPPHGQPPTGYAPYGPPVQPVAGVPAKSAGIAVLLSFIWLGAGHLYANEVGLGIGLIVYDAFLVILALTLIGAIVAVPLWFISAPIVMYLAAQAADNFNQRNGLTVR